MIRDNLPDNMRNELVNMLKEPHYIECCMMKTPMVKLERNHKTQILFITLFLIMICA